MKKLSPLSAFKINSCRLSNVVFLMALISLSLCSCGESPKAESPDIDNTKTAAHINVPGTRLYIIPPSGFTTATAFTGLQKGNDCAFQIYDLIGGNYYTNAATFSKAEFEKKGATVFDFKEIKVNGFPAKYILMQGDPNSKEVGLVFGDTTFSTMIMALYPAADSVTGEEMQKAIRTIYYDKNLKIDPFATAAFTLDDSKSIFKFTKAASGIFIYSVGGANPKPGADSSFITISTLPRDPTMSAQNISDMMVSQFEKYGLTDKQIRNTSTAYVNGQPAYEVEIEGKLQGKSALFYVLVVTGTDKAITIQGILNPGLDSDLDEIRNLANTLKLK